MNGAQLSMEHCDSLGLMSGPPAMALSKSGENLASRPAHRDKTAMNGAQLSMEQGDSLGLTSGPPALRSGFSDLGFRRPSLGAPVQNPSSNRSARSRLAVRRGRQWW